MSSKALRSEQMLKKLGDRLGMTEAGRNWVTLALDPFHDNPVRLDGYPDGSTGNSICQVIKQTMTISAPSGVVSSNKTWDCSIIDWPHVVNANVQQAFNDGGVDPPSNCNIYQTASPSGAAATGGIMVYAAPSGTQLSPSQVGLNVNVTTSQLTLPNTYTVGSHRIISKAFEVHNTSATLYKGGSVLTWRSPVPSTDSTHVFQHVSHTGATVNSSLPLRTLLYEGPPATTAAALRLPQSKQWSAEDGCYVTSALHSTVLGVENGEPVAIYLSDHTSSPGQPMVTTVGFLSSTVLSGSSVPVVSVNKISEFDLCGAYFTGLTAQTTLTLNWNVIVERFPSNDDLELVVLANPSPELDEVALKFYSHAMQQLPTGVPVKANGFGDWFKDVVGTASDFIAPVLSAIPHPGAQALGMGIKVANAGLNPSRSPPQGAAAMMSPYQSVSAASTIRKVVNQETKARNANVKAKNALVRAKNEEIRARKALKGKKK